MKATLGSDLEILNETNGAILENTGKLLRPLLVILSAKAVGGVCPSTIKYAAAAELLHNATLFHDDVVDGAALRRGKPTVVSVMGGTAAVLVGDYWLVKSLQNILSSDVEPSRVLGLFSDTLSDLVAGEMLEIEKTMGCDTTEEEYFRIIRDKTASLFRSSALSGGISAHATPEEEKILSDYAEALGIAFQIKDDIFDYTEGAKVGKPVGQDILEQKITLPLLGALRHAGAGECRDILAKVKDILDHPEYQEDIKHFVASNGGMEYATKVLAEYVGAASEAAKRLPRSEARDALVSLAEYNLIRTI